MLTQERAIICEPEFPNYEAGWPGWVPGRFLGSHPGGNLWHCPLRLGILRCERDGRFQGGQSHATEDPLVGGGLPCDGRE